MEFPNNYKEAKWIILARDRNLEPRLLQLILENKYYSPESAIIVTNLIKLYNRRYTFATFFNIEYKYILEFILKIPNVGRLTSERIIPIIEHVVVTSVYYNNYI